MNPSVFFHVPKNAGTFVINSSLLYFRAWRIKHTNWNERGYETLRNIEVYDGEHIVARLICGDPNNAMPSTAKDPTYLRINKEEMIGTYETLKPFFIVIEDRGFRIWEELLGSINLIDADKYIILRDVFQKAKSFYSYITSDISKHEPTHGIIKGSFEEYIISEQFLCNWESRNLLNIPNSKIYTEEDHEKFHSLLKEFNVFDIKKTDQMITEIFSKLNTSKEDFPSHFTDPMKNQNHAKIDESFNDLSSKTQEVFIEKTKYDNQVHKAYANH